MVRKPKANAKGHISKPVDIRSIAQDTGYSVGTVSMALNNNPQVKQNTREVIQQRAQELGYVPNIIAQLVSSRKNAAFGVMVNNSAPPRFPSIVQGILHECERADQPAFVVYSLDSPENELYYLKIFAQLRIRGLIVSLCPATRCQPVIEELCEQGCQVVIINNEFNDLPVDFVGYDEKKQAADVIETFWRDGHRRIGIAIAEVPHSALEENLAGYVAALNRHKIAIDPALQLRLLYDHRPVRADEHEQNVERLIEFLRLRKPTALLLAMPASVEACEEAAKRLGLRIPEDLEVVSLDILVDRADRETILADMNQGSKLGGAAARLLIERLNESNSKKDPGFKRILLERPVHVLGRRSV